VAAYTAHPPDCVLMDISMVPIDGITATRQIVQSFPTARIVIVTQYDDARLRAAAQGAGARGYVLKENLFEVRRFLEPAEMQPRSV
jgi:DNA-binding NarL/FixJ family response regulator